ncbi:MAG: hypothetical protein HS116_18450 [Planctomycetes bacterium]|nr:hypothetical protein [Planctomycetota bacterium]
MAARAVRGACTGLDHPGRTVRAQWEPTRGWICAGDEQQGLHGCSSGVIVSVRHGRRTKADR